MMEKGRIAGFPGFGAEKPQVLDDQTSLEGPVPKDLDQDQFEVLSEPQFLAGREAGLLALVLGFVFLRSSLFDRKVHGLILGRRGRVPSDA